MTSTCRTPTIASKASSSTSTAASYSGPSGSCALEYTCSPSKVGRRVGYWITGGEAYDDGPLTVEEAGYEIVGKVDGGVWLKPGAADGRSEPPDPPQKNPAPKSGERGARIAARSHLGGDEARGSIKHARLFPSNGDGPSGRAALFRNSAAIGPFTLMIAIAISPAAYDAIKATMLPRIDAAPSPGADGLIRIWFDRQFVDRLGQMRDQGETYSDVILRAKS